MSNAITTRVRAYRPLIERLTAEIWPSLDRGADWFEAQILHESGGDPRAVSLSGAQGLSQFMPATAREVGITDPFNPEQSVRGQITYMRSRYLRLDDVPQDLDRLLWSFAAYNGGLGYVLKAHEQARKDIPDAWWRWNPGKYWLMNRKCSVSWRYPDYRQMWGYVEKILKTWSQAGHS